MDAGMTESFPNGKMKIILGVLGAVFLSLFAWNFSAVQSLQVAVAGHELRVAAMRSDFEAQRASDIAFQSEIRASLGQSAAEFRAGLSRLTDVLTDVRVKLGNDGFTP